MRRLPTVTAVILVTLIMGSAAADQTYTSREDFVSALDDTTWIDFESQPVGPISGDPWMSLGIVFDEAGVGDNMGIGAGGGFDRNIYARGGESADIDITFPAMLPMACGVTVFSNQVQTVPTEYLVFYGEDDTVLISIAMPVTALNTGEFVGYLADAPIARVAFVENDNDSDFAGIGEIICADWVQSPVSRTTWSSVKGLYLK